MGLTPLGAAEDLAEGAALDVEGNIAGDVGHVGAAIGSVEHHAATQGGRKLDGAEVGHIAAAEELVALDGTAAGAVAFNRDADGIDVAVVVTSAVEAAEGATVDLGDGRAVDVGRHRGFEIAVIGTVAAAKDAAEAATVDDKFGVGTDAGFGSHVG